jgi:hypothetical protein
VIPEQLVGAFVTCGVATEADDPGGHTVVDHPVIGRRPTHRRRREGLHVEVTVGDAAGPDLTECH